VELSRALASGFDDTLRTHLKTCPACAAEVESHARVTLATRHLPILEPTADHARTVRASLLGAARVPAAAAHSRALMAAGVGLVLAAAAIALVIGFRPTRSEEIVASGPVYRGSIHAHDGAKFIRVGAAPDEIVRLTQGTLTVEVEKLHPGERFRVVTDDGEVEVRGTAFDVSADGDRLRSVRVLHGRVEVRPAESQAVVLDIGQRWDATKIARVEEPELEPGPGPIAADEPAPAKRPAKPARQRQLTAQAPLPAQAPPPAVKRPIELLFGEGWAALAAGDARKAAAVFEQAARSSPGDPLAEDAWFWHASALARSGSRAAVGALDSFLARYPRSPRAGEASAVLAWLILESDLDRAESLFRAAAGDRVAAVRASGVKGLAAVAARRKDR
jgi:hypothetical protein